MKQVKRTRRDLENWDFSKVRTSLWQGSEAKHIMNQQQMWQLQKKKTKKQQIQE